MKVVITDYTFPDVEIEREILNAAGHELVAWKERKPPAELQELVRDADAVITQFAAINQEVIAGMQRAKVIVRYGIGVDNVDLNAARERRIPVSNIPRYCIDEVADHTLSFLLAATRQVVTNSTAVHSGNWGLAVPITQMRTLKNLTVGVVGFGHIGREVVQRLRGFKCRVLVHDPVVSAPEIQICGGEKVEFEQLLTAADAITLHCPSLPTTKGLISRIALAKMKRGAIFLNLARGDLVDSDALVEALTSGQVSVAGLDVFQPEPIPADHPLLKLPNAILAAHISSASPEAVRTLRETAAQLAATVLAGGTAMNVVNGV